jgi:hypothetical protein
MRIDHILFPVDFSDHSRALNPEVEWLSSHFHSRVTPLHVFEMPTGLPWEAHWKCVQC